MNDPASALAELMNQRHGNHAADPSLGRPRQSQTVTTEPHADEDPSQAGLLPESSASPVATEGADAKHIESIAALVCELLGAKAKPWLQRKLRAWPHVLEDADDLGQLAALAFVEGYKLGRVKPDPQTQRHTASSVSAYLWGICNHIFIDTLRRNRPAGEQHDVPFSETANSSQETSPLQRLLPEEPEHDDESRLWSVLTAVRSRCRPQDIVLTYMLGCGFSSGEIRRLLEISINVPANAIKRVGRAVREVLGLDPQAPAAESKGTQRELKDDGGDDGPNGETGSGISSLSALGLLLQKYFTELIHRLDSPPARSMFLREAAAALGSVGSVAVEQSLADRMYAIRADGDWSWGLLSPEERRELLLRDAKLLVGAGIPDEGTAQRNALKKLVSELGEIFQELDKALLGDDLDWLLPIAEHLHVVLGFTSKYKEMRERYRHLLEAARRLNSPRLEMTAQLGFGKALVMLSEYTEACEALERAAGLARELNEPRAEIRALRLLANAAGALGDTERWVELHRKGLSISREIGDRYGEAAALAGLAFAHHSLGELKSSEELQIRALKIRREIGDRQGESHSLGNLGAVYGSMGHDLRSAEMYTECMMLCHDLGDRRGEARALNGLAILHSSHGEYQAATEKFTRVIKIFREIGEREGEAHAQLCLAGMYMAQKKYARTAEITRRALEIYTATGNRHGETEALCGLGVVALRAENDLEAARDRFWQSLSISVELGLKGYICRVCAFASACLAMLGSLRQSAVSYYGAMRQLDMNKYDFDQNEQKFMDQALTRLEAAVDSGEITTGELAQWRAEGEALELDELAQYVLTALHEPQLQG